MSSIASDVMEDKRAQSSVASVVGSYCTEKEQLCSKAVVCDFFFFFFSSSLCLEVIAILPNQTKRKDREEKSDLSSAHAALKIVHHFYSATAKC